MIVAAKTDPNATHAMGLFLVERGMPGFERGRNLAKMGMKAQDTAELFFENVRIPADNVLGPPEGGFFMLMKGLAEERLIAAVGNVVGCQMAMHVTKEFVQNRKVFGKPLSKFQNTRFKLAELDAEIDIAQTYVDRAVQVHNEGQLDVGRCRAHQALLERARRPHGRRVPAAPRRRGLHGRVSDLPDVPG